MYGLSKSLMDYFLGAKSNYTMHLEPTIAGGNMMEWYGYLVVWDTHQLALSTIKETSHTSLIFEY